MLHRVARRDSASPTTCSKDDLARWCTWVIIAHESRCQTGVSLLVIIHLNRYVKFSKNSSIFKVKSFHYCITLLIFPLNIPVSIMPPNVQYSPGTIDNEPCGSAIFEAIAHIWSFQAIARKTMLYFPLFMRTLIRIYLGKNSERLQKY